MRRDNRLAAKAEDVNRSGMMKESNQNRVRSPGESPFQTPDLFFTILQNLVKCNKVPQFGERDLLSADTDRDKKCTFCRLA